MGYSVGLIDRMVVFFLTRAHVLVSLVAPSSLVLARYSLADEDIDLDNPISVRDFLARKGFDRQCVALYPDFERGQLEVRKALTWKKRGRGTVAFSSRFYLFGRNRTKDPYR